MFTVLSERHVPLASVHNEQDARHLARTIPGAYVTFQPDEDPGDPDEDEDGPEDEFLDEGMSTAERQIVLALLGERCWTTGVQ